VEGVLKTHATGSRKTAAARAFLTPGKGLFLVNNKTPEEYFRRPTLVDIVMQPLVLTGTVGQFDIRVHVEGGGISGQAGAVRHAVSRALIEYNPEFHPVLKKAGLLTRDPREKERKKYGLKRARKASQYRKR
jgi:small subunit ribosomal protein S9